MDSTRSRVTSMRKKPKRLTPRSNSVSGALRASWAETWPNSVLMPVRTTTAAAVPLTTWVPMNKVLVRLLRGRSGAKTPASFSTGKVSPVSAAGMGKHYKKYTRKRSLLILIFPLITQFLVIIGWNQFVTNMEMGHHIIII